MKYCFASILSILLLISCQNTTPVSTPEVPQSAPEAKPTPIETPKPVEGVPHEASKPIGPEYPVQNVKKIFTVHIESLNYTDAQNAKLDKAQTLITKIINSDDYKKEVLNWKFTNTNGLTNQQIYDKLFAGAEALLPAINYQMDLKVEMYHSYGNTVGYTYPDDLVVHTNSKYHNNYSPCDIASNFTHEWTHKMGFDHSSANDSNSVPYAHNSIIEKLCGKFQ